MSKQKSKWILLSVLFIVIVIVAGFLSKGLIASWLTKETLQSSVEISLLLQGDEADIYESPVTLTSKGTYELAKIGVKDTDGSYDGLNVSGVEPSRQNLYDYVMPGVNIPKDPKVFITKKSGAHAYLYIEVIEDNFPEYFTEEGFEELGVNDPEQNPNEVKPIYYDLEDYWTPVYTAEGKQAVGLNGGALYVYYNENDYFKTNSYNKNFTIEIGDDSDKETINQGVTCLSSYIMKDESNGPDKIDKQKYYGINEVKTVDGQPMDCPYFNILKEDTVYVSEKYIHPEYYSTLYTDLGKKAGNRSETVKYGYDFGLYINSYMASAKINGEYANPFDAFTNAGFISEKDYLIEQYRANDENPEGFGAERIVYVWNEDELQVAVDDYFEDGLPYKIVMMNDIVVYDTVTVEATSDFIFDMNNKTLYCPDNHKYNTPTYGDYLWVHEYKTVNGVRVAPSVTFRGDGTFDFGNTDTCGFIYFGTLTIENGNFVRDYDPTHDGHYAFSYANFFPGVGNAELVIYDGYFDNGYWCLDETVSSKSYYIKKDENGNPTYELPVYDTKNGKWLKNEDGSYKTATKADGGINLYTKASDGTITTEFTDEYIYGPCARGFHSAINKSSGPIRILGGTFVVQNPAWGDELCAQNYKDNPFSGLYSANIQGTILEGQGRLDTDLPDWYEIIEGKTTYSYTDEAGNKVEFYVPTYTVKCDEELLHNSRNGAVQLYEQGDDDEEKLRDASGNPKAGTIVPLWQDGRVVYVFDEEDLKLAVADYFGDGQLYKIVLMEDINVADQINVSNTSNFIFDMNEKTLYATRDKYSGTNAMWLQNYSSVTKQSNVIIRGNGTFDLGNYNVSAFYGRGNLTIEDGYYIRDYDPERTSATAVSQPMFLSGNNMNITINGGYFDNGYWYVSDEVSATESFYKTDTKELPVYDTVNGTGWLKENGEYVTAVPGDANYGPDPYGAAQIFTDNAVASSKITVYGGEFVLQNPAWGNQMCAQAYTENPYSGLYYGDKYATFLEAQGRLDTELPKGYEIVEGNTKYSYVDENGETVEFYVPTYTVKCDEEKLLNDRIEAVQAYEETDDDVEKLREETGTPKAAAYFPLLQDGRVVYVFDEEDLKLAVDNYFNDAKLYKIVLMEDINVVDQIKVTNKSNFIFDMNGNTLSATTDSYTTSDSTNAMWLQAYTNATQQSNVIIRGNGTFDLGNYDIGAFYGKGKLTIEDGSYIRDYDPDRTSATAVSHPMFLSGTYMNITINGGYFDNGYWYVSDESNGTDDSFYIKKDENGNQTYELPVYDTANGTGWLKENGEYVTAEPGDDNYGPDPYGAAQIFTDNAVAQSMVTVYGGTFVLQNPAWGNQMCAQAYTDNPYSGLYYGNKYATFLEAQGRSDTTLPKGYKIIEENTKYSYVNEDGETVVFYVPTYTVECNKEELLNGRSEAVQEYKESDADVEKLREETGTPKAAAYFPLLQDGRVVYVFDEEDLKLAVDNYFNDAKLYKIVLMEDINVANMINVTNKSNFIFDMNENKLSATSTTGTLMWKQNYSSATQHSNVVIRGNGTFDLGNYNIDCFTPSGKLTIEDGNYIRDYDPERTSATAVNYSIFNETKNSTVTIKGGYFDNGYWNLTGSINGTYKTIKLGSTTHKVLPIYDTTEGKWLRDEAGNYIRAIKDGTGVKFVTVEGSTITASGEHNPDYAFGPCARGFHTILNKSTTNSQVYVLGGTFVVQNPAWGNQMCAQDYIDNPFSGLYAPTNYGTFLYGQTYSNTAPSTADGYQELPAGYSIAEGKTTYSYVNDEGTTVEFFVPTYTVSSTETVKDEVEALVG